MSDDPTLERSFRGHKDAVTSVVFNPNMKQLVSGSLDGSIMIWNFKPHLRAYRYSDHEGPVLSVAVSNTGGIIASGSKDRTIRLWAPNVSKSRSTVIKGHTGGVRRVAFSDDSCSLLSASDDKTIKVWSVSGQKFRQTLSGHSNWVRSASFNSTGDLIVSGGDDKTVRIWDLAQRSCVHKFFDHTGPVHDVHFHPDGVCVAACSADKTIKIWDLRMQQLLQHYSAHEEDVNSIDIHPSGDFLISASSDMSTKIWDLREGHICYTLQGHDKPVNAVAFSPQGDYFATASSDENILVWKSNFDRDIGQNVLFEQQSGRPSSSLDGAQQIKKPGPLASSNFEVRRSGSDAEQSSQKSSRASRTSLACSSQSGKIGLLQSQDSLLSEFGHAEPLRPASAPTYASSIHLDTDDKSRAYPVGSSSRILSSGPAVADAIDYVQTKTQPTQEVLTLQMALESMSQRMEAVQEAVQLLDRRLFVAETRLARLESSG